MNRQQETEQATYRNGCDDAFYALLDRLKTESLTQLLTVAAQSALQWLQDDHAYYGMLLKNHREWYGVGAFAQDQGYINHFGQIYGYLQQNTAGLASLYENLADYRSKMTLKIMLQHWLTFHPKVPFAGTEKQFDHYFDLDVFHCDRNEVFVDCGTEYGDTVEAYIRNYGQYKSIYSYELTPNAYEIAKRNLQGIPRVHLRNLGVSNVTGELPYAIAGTGGGASRLDANSNTMAKVVKIDDDIQEDVTFIKMDIEGGEIDALQGAEQQIRRNKPKLAISAYHKLSDLLEIPRLILQYVPDYQLYIRFEGHESVSFPVDYVLLAAHPG